MNSQSPSQRRKAETSEVKIRLLNLLDNQVLDMGFICALSGDRPLTEEEQYKFDEMVRQNGDLVYSEMLFILTHEMVKPDEARELWEGILKHKYEMSVKLGRNVGLAVATTDYMCNIKGTIQSPSLITKRGMKVVADVALRDSLTGLFDHFTFLEKLEVESKRAERYSTPLSLLFLDLDNFKVINDTYGHVKGDEVLSKMGALIQAEIREIDIAARYGGEEFTILLPHAINEEARCIAERVRSRIEKEEFRTNSGEIFKVTISIGLSSSPFSATSSRDLLERADKALYLSKKGGKNRTTSDTER